MQQLDRHRLAVREPQALDRDDRLGRRDVEDPAEARAGRHHGEARGCGCRASARGARMSSLNEEMSMPFATFGSATNVPDATPAHEVALAHELFERGAHRQPRDAEVEAELPLGGDRVADARARRSAPAPCSRVSRCLVTMRHASSGTPSAASRAPVSRVEEMEPRGRRPRARRSSPTRAVVRGVDPRREQRLAWPANRRPTADSSTSAVIGGASTVKKMWASEPSSSSTSTRTRDRRQARRERRVVEAPRAGCPSTTRSRPPAGGARRRAARGTARSARVVALDRRLDQVHRRRADERGDEEVVRGARRAPAGGRTAGCGRRASPRPAGRASSPRSGRASRRRS